MVFYKKILMAVAATTVFVNLAVAAQEENDGEKEQKKYTPILSTKIDEGVDWLKDCRCTPKVAQTALDAAKSLAHTILNWRLSTYVVQSAGSAIDPVYIRYTASESVPSFAKDEFKLILDNTPECFRNCLKKLSQAPDVKGPKKDN